MIDYLIVGQGLAGTTLSYYLLKKGKKVVIVDDSNNKSSKVAAGLYNPITGRNMVKTWMADELFEGVEMFYEELEKDLGVKFLHKKRIYKPFKSIKEQNDWEAKTADPGLKKFIHQVYSRPLYKDSVHDPFGGLEIARSGYVDLNVFLDAYSKYLRENGLLINQNVDQKDLKIRNGYFEWKDYKTENLVFCDGISSNSNNLFGWLPFQPLKGEVLTIEMKCNFKHIVNRGVFVLEMEKGRFIVGSTYNREDPFSGISESGKLDLMGRLEQLIKIEYKIVDHRSGIRPSTKDRRPFIGEHPGIKKMWIFNGLGAKGVTLAPYFAKLFTEYLVSNKVLDPIVNTNRYYSLYYR